MPFCEARILLPVEKLQNHTGFHDSRKEKEDKVEDLLLFSRRIFFCPPAPELNSCLEVRMICISAFFVVVSMYMKASILNPSSFLFWTMNSSSDVTNDCLSKCKVYVLQMDSSSEACWSLSVSEIQPLKYRSSNTLVSFHRTSWAQTVL